MNPPVSLQAEPPQLSHAQESTAYRRASYRADVFEHSFTMHMSVCVLFVTFAVNMEVMLIDSRRPEVGAFNVHGLLVVGLAMTVIRFLVHQIPDQDKAARWSVAAMTILHIAFASIAVTWYSGVSTSEYYGGDPSQMFRTSGLVWFSHIPSMEFMTGLMFISHGFEKHTVLKAGCIAQVAFIVGTTFILLQSLDDKFTLLSVVLLQVPQQCSFFAGIHLGSQILLAYRRHFDKIAEYATATAARHGRPLAPPVCRHTATVLPALPPLRDHT